MIAYLWLDRSECNDQPGGDTQYIDMYAELHTNTLHISTCNLSISLFVSAFVHEWSIFKIFFLQWTAPLSQLKESLSLTNQLVFYFPVPAITMNTQTNFTRAVLR